MATPITHIAITQQLYEEFFSKHDKAAFIVGTSFPDIRKPANLNWNSTHFASVLSYDLHAVDDFTAGLRFHSLLDLVREDLIAKSGIYDYLERNDYTAVSAIKYREDELMYGTVSNWREVVGYFNTVLKQELTFGSSKDQVVHWHKLLQSYFSESPSLKTQTRFTRALNFSELDALLAYIQTVRKDPLITKMLGINLQKLYAALQKSLG